METTLTGNVVCSTCMEVFKNSDTISVTACGHVFHQDCIQKWRQRCLACPLCRAPTSNIKQVFLTFDNSRMEFLEQQLKNCETTIAKVNEDLEKSEMNFLQLQKQYTEAREEIVQSQLKNKLRADNWKSEFNALEKQYTDAEETILKLLTQLDMATKNDKSRQEKIESISNIYWARKIDVLKQKLNQTRDLPYKEMEIYTNLSSENVMLKSLLDQYDAENQEKEKAMMDKKKNKNILLN